jgi:hypothetical protein
VITRNPCGSVSPPKAATDTGFDAARAEYRRDALGVHENVLVMLLIAPPGPVCTAQKRGHVADESVR